MQTPPKSVLGHFFSPPKEPHTPGATFLTRRPLPLVTSSTFHFDRFPIWNRIVQHTGSGSFHRPRFPGSSTWCLCHRFIPFVARNVPSRPHHVLHLHPPGGGHAGGSHLLAPSFFGCWNDTVVEAHEQVLVGSRVSFLLVAL